jgi:hypothetical protein
MVAIVFNAFVFSVKLAFLVEANLSLLENKYPIENSIKYTATKYKYSVVYKFGKISFRRSDIGALGKNINIIGGKMQ